MAGVVGFEPTPYGFEDRHTTNYTKPLSIFHLLHNHYIINFNKNQIKLLAPIPRIELESCAWQAHIITIRPYGHIMVGIERFELPVSSSQN